MPQNKEKEQKKRKEGKDDAIFPNKITQTWLEAFSKYIKDEDTYCNSDVDGIWSVAELYLCVCVCWGGGLVPRGVVRGTGNNKIRNIVEHHQGNVLEGNSGSLKRPWLFCKIMRV